MKLMDHLKVIVFVLFLSIGWCGSVFGYSTIVAYGDSLSDNGNIGRFTDGPLWVELLAEHYSANLLDFAHGGATTSYDNPAAGLPVTGLLWQVDMFGSVLGGLSSADTLVSVWAGANDLLQGRSPVDAVNNISIALNNLYLAGGRDFLIPNLPNVGMTPAFLAGAPATSDGATAWTLGFNSLLGQMLAGVGSIYSDATFYFVDMFTVFEKYPVGSPEWGELFWAVDGFHPSSAGHDVIFKTVRSSTDPVPEPATMLLFVTGIAGLGLGRRRRRKA